MSDTSSTPAAGARHRDTLAVTAGRPAVVADAPLNAPITMASTYVAGGGTEYGRYGNPTWTAFEDALGALEGGRALSFASGQAAIACVLDLVGNGEKVVAPRHAYTGTIGQLGDLAARDRLETDLVDVTDVEAVRAACEEAAILWLESPSNPAMEVLDLPALIEVAHGAGARVVVDNTFATAMRQRPLELGADIVVLSATKLVAGHSDLLMGALVVPEDPEGEGPQLFDVLKGRRDLIGAVPGPFEAWLALRGLRTLPVRLDRAEQTATALAERLSGHPAVTEVRYPGWGSMLALVVADADRADLLVRDSSLVVHATSLGGVESSWERRRRWKMEAETIPEGLVRLSVGLEDVEDLWRDVSGALDRLP
ncbi:PLP-dependent transferase [Nocardioidaceae bacterium]|nr:PLP-dependent transferase [Nocardioidaceae bacterium]